MWEQKKRECGAPCSIVLCLERQEMTIPEPIEGWPRSNFDFFLPNHMRFMEDGEPVRQPDPIPQPDRTPSPNPMLRRYRTNHMRFME